MAGIVNSIYISSLMPVLIYLISTCRKTPSLNNTGTMTASTNITGSPRVLCHLDFDELIQLDAASTRWTQPVGRQTRRDARVAEQVSTRSHSQSRHRLKADDARVVVDARVSLPASKRLKVRHGRHVLPQLRLVI